MILAVHGSLPGQWQDKPELTDREEWFFEAFFELNTTRSLGFGIGPIPWTALLAYSQEMGLCDDEFDEFRYLITALDTEYREIIEQDESKKQAKGHGGQKNQRGHR